MSEQYISPELRHAIWLAGGGRCAYCSEPLTFAEVDIDHVIPESISKDASAFSKLRAELGLPLDFTTQSYANLLPAHRRCNRMKSNRVFAPEASVLFLRVAADNAPKIARLLDGARRVNTKDTLLLGLTKAITEGLIMPSEILRPTNDPTIIHMEKPIRFGEREVFTVAPDDVEVLLDESVFGFGGLEFFNQGGPDPEKKVQVDTCREYRNATAMGYYPRRSNDIKLSSQFKTIDAVLDAASKVRIPRASFIRSPYKGVVDLDLLPAEILPVVSLDDSREIATLAGQSLAELLVRGELTISKCSSTQVSLMWHWGFELSEVCRSDFNNDGLEDILCECYCWAPGGTLGFGWNILLSRRSQNGLFEVERI